MNWEAIGAGAELLAAIGGVVAIFYLAVQIRINTRAVRSASIDSWVTAISLGNQALASTDEFIATANENYDELVPQQRILFHRALAQNMNAMEALYLHHSNGVVDDIFFESKMRSMISIFQSSGVRRWWSEKGINYLDPRFVKYVEALVD
ncbi:MAG: hypothetical protein H6985_19945 [Pseudomonadales bacterium]|nr:hypothetical protein [Pseudomonadales bacterium]